MKKTSALLAIDQGTTSSRAIVFSTNSDAIASAQKELRQHYPQDGWVEHDPEEIWQSTLFVMKEAYDAALKKNAVIKAIGITNQRETTLVWHRETGETLCKAIVWQDRRTAAFCARLEKEGHAQIIKEKTGLLPDPYFSASKLRWILDNIPNAKMYAESGKLCFGTVDTFLIWRLTQGKVFATDATNASRTSLFNIHDNAWDKELLAIYGIPLSVLPEVKDCADDYGTINPDILGEPLPIRGVAGDQHAATIGQACFHAGDIKSTYGTGCFVMLNTGTEAIESKHNLLTTIGYRLNGQTTYALEGSIFIAGAAVQWLRDGLHLIQKAADSEALAMRLPSNEGVFMVPAFTGIGAPYWAPNARGAILGLSRNSSAEHMCRAALEAVCYQTYDLLDAMHKEGITLKNLKVDGGMVANQWFTQFLTCITQLPVIKPKHLETTALGAAYLAGLSIGEYASLNDISHQWQGDTIAATELTPSTRKSLLERWHKAVELVLNFSVY